MTNLIYRASSVPTTPGSTSVKGLGLTNAEIDGNMKSLSDDIGSKEVATNKNIASGYPGLNASRALQLINTAGTFTSVLQNAATAIRTYTVKDADGTIAFMSDITSGTSAGSFTTLATSGGLLVNGSATLAATNNLQLSYEAPNTRYYVGDGTGYSFRFSKRVGSVTTDLITIADSGGMIIAGTLSVNGAITGTTAGVRLPTASPVYFNAGFNSYIQEVSAGNIQVVAGGSAVASFTSAGLAVTGALSASALPVSLIDADGAYAGYSTGVAYFGAKSNGANNRSVTIRALSLGNAVDVANFSSAGLAVTGALSASVSTTIGAGTGSPTLFINGGTAAGQGGSLQLQQGGVLRGIVAPYAVWAGVGTDAGTVVSSQGALSLYLATNGVVRQTIDSNGAVTIAAGLAVTGALSSTGAQSASTITVSGSTVPSNGMYYVTTSTLGWSTAGVARLSLNGTGDLVATGNITAYSDERLKTNWRNLPEEFVDKLSSVKFGIYDRLDQDTTQVGVSAQSLQQLMPNAVLEDSTGMLSVSYGPAALAACIELAKEIKALKSEIQLLKGL